MIKAKKVRLSKKKTTKRLRRKLCVNVGDERIFLQWFLTSSDISSSCNLEEPGLKESLVVLVMVGGPIARAGEGEKEG